MPDEENFPDTMRRLLGPPDEVIVGDDGIAREVWHQHPKHIATAMINDDIKRNGTPWVKCPNCGEPFVQGAVQEDGYDPYTLCSKSCEGSYLAYINNPSESFSSNYDDRDYL